MPAQSLQQIFSAYPTEYHPRQWCPPKMSGGFSGAVILRLETNRGPFCLRGWPVGSLPAERIRGLHRLLAHVHKAGVSEVAVPAATCQGDTLAIVNEQFWQLEPWLPGKADYWSFPSRSRLRNVMSRLAAFHQRTRNYRDAGSAERWFFYQDQAPSPAVAERLSYLKAWQQSKLAMLKQALLAEIPPELRDLGREFAGRFESLAPLIGAQLELLSRVAFCLQPCLRDLWHDHVLFTGDQVTGLIDASASRSENIATDLSRLLGSLLMDDRQAWEFAIQEYEQHRPLTSDEKSLVSALDQSGVLLSAMAWMDRLLLKRETVAHWPKVLDRLAHFQKRLKHLDETITRSLWLGRL